MSSSARQIFRQRAVILTSLLVSLSLWHVTIAAMFCPYMNGGNYCEELTDSNTIHAASPIANSDSTLTCKFHQAESSNDVHMNGGQHHGSRLTVDRREQVHVAIVSLRLLNERESGVMTEVGNDTCRHCMLHSENEPTTTGSSPQLRQSVNESPVLLPVRKALSLSKKSFADLYQLGPPGRSSPRYVLLSEFRI